MKKFLKIFLWIIFFPAILIFWILKLFIKGLRKKKSKEELKNIRIESIDTLNGFQFEKFVGEIFKAFGYKTKVTKKSGDNGADILASKHGRIFAVQTKMYYNHTVGNKAVQEAHSAKFFYNTHVAVVICNSHFSKSAVDTAKKLGVVLIGREELSNILKLGFDNKTYSLDRYLAEYF